MKEAKERKGKEREGREAFAVAKHI